MKSILVVGVVVLLTACPTILWAAESPLDPGAYNGHIDAGITYNYVLNVEAGKTYRVETKNATGNLVAVLKQNGEETSRRTGTNNSITFTAKQNVKYNFLVINNTDATVTYDLIFVWQRE